MPGPEPLQPSDPSAFGDYSVTGRLGKGGQGIVYLAEDAQGEKVAVKVLNDQWSRDNDLRKRFEKEVRAAQKVASFCTAAIIDAQLDSDPPYVVSEFVPGKDLQETVAKGAPLRGSALQRLAVSTATALVAIHKAGIVHRDFKPGNVLLGPDGPRVIDFGIARVDDGTATMTNSIVGTPSYMAPEQIEGSGITDKCDIFAWGCVIAFASSGRAPFGSDTVPAVVHRVISSPPDIDGVDDALRPIVAACLDKNPANRPTAQRLLMRLLGHEEAEEAPSAEDAVKQGEQIAQTGLIPQGQLPLPPQTGPQGGFGPGRRTVPPVHPGTGPQHGLPAQGHPGFPPPGTSNPQHGMGLPVHPGTSNPQHGMGLSGHPGGPYPQGNQPQFTGPLTTGNPGQTYGGPAQQQSSEDSILQQSWVIPAVLMTILILALLLVLIAVSG